MKKQILTKPDKYVQLVQVSYSHPWTDGVMYVDEDGKLKPLKDCKRHITKCRCK
jgi:hypothetical protein